MKPYPFDQSQGEFSDLEKELTPVEIFYQNGLPSVKDFEIYITHLERTIVSKNEMIKVVLDATPEKLSFHRIMLNKILKL